MDTMEIVAKGQTYRIGKMVAMKQAHVLRRLAPLTGSFLALIKSLPKPGGESNDTPGEEKTAEDQAEESVNFLALTFEQMEPLTSALAAIPDKDVEFLIAACMEITKRSMGSGTGWAPIWNKQANIPMMADIDLQVMMTIVWNTLWHNFQGFMPAARLNGVP